MGHAQSKPGYRWPTHRQGRPFTHRVIITSSKRGHLRTTQHTSLGLAERMATDWRNYGARHPGDGISVEIVPLSLGRQYLEPGTPVIMEVRTHLPGRPGERLEHPVQSLYITDAFNHRHSVQWDQDKEAWYWEAQVADIPLEFAKKT